MELDENGKVKDAKKFMDSQKDVWGDFVATTKTTGAKVDTPPTNNSGVSKEDFEKMSLMPVSSSKTKILSCISS